MTSESQKTAVQRSAQAAPAIDLAAKRHGQLPGVGFDAVVNKPLSGYHLHSF
jgi:hypothetical protein